MRYNSIERLQEWKDTGNFPKIHDDIFEMIMARLKPGEVFCDICCSTGLLGQRLLEAGHAGFGLEMQAREIKQAHDFGVKLSIYQRVISRELVSTPTALFGEMVDALVARRCFSEIFMKDDFSKAFSFELIESGVKQVFLQGRRKVNNPTCKLHCVELEAEMLTKHGWTITYLEGELAHLVAP